MARTPRVEGQLPCDACGSSDAGSRYADGSFKCHKCGHKVWNGEVTTAAKGMVEVAVQGIPERKIPARTAQLFRYGLSPKGNQVAQYCDKTGRVVAQKVRRAGKKFVWLGDRSKVGLYGDWLWRDGGRRIVVTEGEIDALSYSAVNADKWPTVSVPDGAGSAPEAIKRSLRFLEAFERVVLMFDMDDPGREAAERCAQILSPGKAHIAHLPMKDANECLMAGKGEAIMRAMWDAKPWSPDGLLTGDDLWKALAGSHKPTLGHFPFTELDAMTRGYRLGEIVLIVAGIGAGKSTLCREVVSGALDQGLKVGAMPLEETVSQYCTSIVGRRVGRNFSVLDGDPLADPICQDAFSKIKDSLVFYDDAGRRDEDTIFGHVRHMALGFGCQVVVLDHLTALISSSASDDDRRYADKLMTNLASLVKRTGLTLFVVVHLRKAGEGRAHEQGRPISMAEIRGSGMVPAFAHTIVAYERDQQAENPNIGQLRLLKCRYTGRTGKAGKVRYDQDTGALVEYDEGLDTGVEAGF